ncbi:MAG: hypothetical protein EOO20_26365, partial [Chryseobacterium sp.]
DGTIKGYRPDEYNIDHVNNGKLLLLLYRVTGKDKYRGRVESPHRTREERYKARTGKQNERTGEGMSKKFKPIDFTFLPYSQNERIKLEYFDDSNELCDRLRLLIASRKAGNSNHMHEINSILEELRELKHIE